MKKRNNPPPKKSADRWKLQLPILHTSVTSLPQSLPASPQNNSFHSHFRNYFWSPSSSCLDCYHLSKCHTIFTPFVFFPLCALLFLLFSPTHLFLTLKQKHFLSSFLFFQTSSPKRKTRKKINICFDRPAVMWLTRSSADSISVPVPSVPPHSGFVSSLAVHVFPPPSVSAHNHRSVYHSNPPSSSPSAHSPTGSPLPVATHQNKPCKHWISQSRLAVFLSAQLLGSKSTSRMSETSTQRNVNVYQLLHFQFRFSNCFSHLTLYKLEK